MRWGGCGVVEVSSHRQDMPLLAVPIGNDLIASLKNLIHELQPGSYKIFLDVP